MCLCKCKGSVCRKSEEGLDCHWNLALSTLLGGGGDEMELSGWGCILKWPHSISKGCFKTPSCAAELGLYLFNEPNTGRPGKHNLIIWLSECFRSAGVEQKRAGSCTKDFQTPRALNRDQPQPSVGASFTISHNPTLRLLSYYKKCTCEFMYNIHKIKLFWIIAFSSVKV